MRGKLHAWESFARDRGYRLLLPAGSPDDELGIDARVDGVAIALRSRVEKRHGLRTEARAVARHAMLGRVEVRSARWLDGLTGLVRRRRTTGHGDLDARLSTFTSSAALLATILDPLTIEVLRALGDKPRFALVYEDGAIALRWDGTELVPATLDAALRLCAHLAVSGDEKSPYR